ncbi:MAG: polynucleotide adenylyltransferase, partial [Lachnospiraceae bacterium]|nr:polynucleotide adenylyltransferase [Lachnospiraceae bacterium]
MGEDIFSMIFTVRRADIAAQSDYMRKEKLEKVAYIEKLYQDILKNKEAVSLKDLAVTGNDLIAEGIPPGRQIGETLNVLLERVLDDPSLNKRETLLGICRNL